MKIETNNFITEVQTLEELKTKTKRTKVSDNLAKMYGFEPEQCAMGNANLFVFDYVKNNVLIYDFFDKERYYFQF